MSINIHPEVLITYSSKYGGTAKVAKAISKGIKGSVTISELHNIIQLDYDYIIIGAPIFNNKHSKEIDKFISKFEKEVRNIKKSAFIVTDTNENVNKNLKKIALLLNKLPGEVDAVTSLSGELSFSEIEDKESRIKNSNIDTEACIKFGKRINKIIQNSS